MNKFIPILKLVFVSLSHVLALAAFVYVAIMGGVHFKTLGEHQVAYLQILLVNLAPLLAVKIGEAVTNFKNGGNQ